jgi:hypothetical protein
MAPARQTFRVILAIIATLTLVSCTSVRVEGFNNPTLPGQQWRLYGGVEIGYAITLPRGWSAFDLNTQLDLGSRICALNSQLAEERRKLMSELHSRGVRLFACDQSRDAEPRIPVAYAVTGPTPSEGLDKYLDKTRQVEGREVIDRRHVNTNAGDMVVQKVHERRPMTDGSFVETTQYQFLVIRFGALHLFFVDFPTALQDAVGKDAELMGTSFTPVR